MAIAHYQAALEIYTREAFPQEWAMTQNNLGAAYFNRIGGERSQNLEMAIAPISFLLHLAQTMGLSFENYGLPAEFLEYHQ